MKLSFDPISSPDAARDLFVDLSAALEADETLALATVKSGYATVVEVSNVAINDLVVTIDERVTSPGQGVHFTVQTLLESQAAVPITVAFEGTSGSRDKYEIIQPVVPALSS